MTDCAHAPAPSNNEDVRYLGKLLGDVIRDHGGEALFRETERIRAASVERHRRIAGGEDVAGPASTLGLDRLGPDETLDFVRGFLLFSLLANLAEDRQGIAAEHGADFAGALARLKAEGIGRDAVLDLLGYALVAPVLTAHPTEVRRKSMVDHRNRVAELMALRDRGLEETPAGDRVEEAIVRQIALLWQTRVLRREKLTVADEVETALSYLRDVFLPVLPALYQRWDRELGERTASFLRPGTWIGGDRDGNPFVTADSLRTALQRSSEAVLDYYLAAVDALGAELSISCDLAAVDAAVLDLATASGDDAPSRADEPYRRALSRHLCAARGDLPGDRRPPGGQGRATGRRTLPRRAGVPRRPDGAGARPARCGGRGAGERAGRWDG